MNHNNNNYLSLISFENYLIPDYNLNIVQLIQRKAKEAFIDETVRVNFTLCLYDLISISKSSEEQQIFRHLSFLINNSDKSKFSNLAYTQHLTKLNSIIKRVSKIFNSNIRYNQIFRSTLYKDYQPRTFQDNNLIDL